MRSFLTRAVVAFAAAASAAAASAAAASAASAAASAAAAPVGDPARAAETLAPGLSYEYLGAGFIAAGGDLSSGNMTLAQAEAACTADARCVALTFASASRDCGGGGGGGASLCLVYLKNTSAFTPSAGWQAYANGRAPPPSPWGPAVDAYRALVAAQSKDAAAWATAAAAVRAWTAARDPHSPVFHFRSVEGWLNDPNGLTFDAATGLYHRFYQARVVGGAFDGRIAWGNSVSRDLVRFSDLPIAMYPDTAFDGAGVFSGNCVIDSDSDSGGGGGGGTPTCVYTGFLGSGHDADGVCARSEDRSWVNFTKTDCMDKSRAPNPNSPVNWDSSVWRDNVTWFCLVGGATAAAQGTGFLWSSPDLRSWSLATPEGIWPGGPCGFWELPYLLPFDDAGSPATHEAATRHALVFGCGNSYFVGAFNRSSLAFERQASQTAAFVFDPGSSYSINPSFVDNKGPGGALRRVMLTWVTGAASPTAAVPYWQGAHSVPCALSLSPLGSGGGGGGSAAQAAPGVLLQAPVPELAALRGAHFAPVRVAPAAGTNESALAVSGDALEVSFAVDLAASAAVSRIGLLLRLTPDRSHWVSVWLAPATLTFGTDALGAGGALLRDSAGGGAAGNNGALRDGELSADCSGDGAARASGTALLRAFVDKSVIELFCGGGAIRVRDFPADPAAAVGIAPFAEGPAGAAGAGTVEAWAMGSMWG